MPSTISFLPAPAPAPAPASASSTSSSGQASSDSGASFDSALNQASPASSGKSGPRTSVTGTSRAALAEKTAKADKAAKESGAESSSADTARSPLSAEELAALLALMGTPAAPQQPPLVAVSVDPTLSAEAAEISDEAESAAGSSMPQATADNDGEMASQAGACAEEIDANAVFSLDAASEVTARDLLKQGAEVIDYQLQPAGAESGAVDTASQVSSELAKTAAAETTPASTASIPASSSAVTESAVDSATFAQQSQSAGQPVDATSLRRFQTSKTAGKAATEKIAAALDSGVPPSVSGVKSSIESNKNNFLNVVDKEVAKDVPVVGTSAANWGDSMNPDARSTPFVARLIDGALSLLGTSAGTAGLDRSSETTATPAVSTTQAAQIVSEIRDIADGLWAVERNSVEVRFNFSENERLSVKVEYRNGVVQTTFRTDSPELRDTIAREWQSQVASASDARPYRVADPVFNTPPADARGFSLGGDSSRQQRQAEQSASAHHTFATASGRGSSSSPVAAAPAAAFTRPDTAVHLHAFA